jgi:hypothetical protein
MGKLAYNPCMVNGMLTRMTSAETGLAAITCSEQEAMGAMICVRSAQRELTWTYIPLATRVANDTSMRGGKSAEFDDDDIRYSLMRTMTGYGWLVADDPLDDDPSTVTPEEARALGAALNSGDVLEDMESTGELVWLQQTLAVVEADPVLRQQFLSNFSDWEEAMNRLGFVQLEASNNGSASDGASRAAAALGSIASLAHIFATGPAMDDYEAVVGTMDSYAGALFAVELPLSDNQLAHIGYDLVKRRYDGETPTIDFDFPGDNTADVVFRELIGRPEAAATFLGIAAHDEPAVIFNGLGHGQLIEELLVAGTSPDVLTEQEAGEVLVPLLQFTHEYGDDMGFMYRYGDGFELNAHLVMSSVVAPWLLNITSRDTQWGWTDDEATDVLNWIVADDDAADRLTELSTAYLQHLSSIAIAHPDGSLNITELNDAAGLIAELGNALRLAHIDDAAAARFWADATLLLAGMAVTALGPGGFALGVLKNVGAAAGSPLIDDLLTSVGVFPPTAEESERKYNQLFADQMTNAAVVAFVAAAAQLTTVDRVEAAVGAHRLADLVERGDAEAVNGCLLDIAQDLGLGDYDETKLIAVVQTFLNPGFAETMND